MKLSFVGTGMIGGGLAVNAALHGYDVSLYDLLDPEKVKTNIRGIFNIMVESGACTEQEAEKAMSLMTFTQNIKEAVEGAVFIQECVPERLELKQETYRKIQEIVGDNAIIASSTSTIFPSKLSDGALFPNKIIVGHPFNPSYVLPLIEVCGPQADMSTIDEAVKIYKSMGKEPVICKKEVNGFIANILSLMVKDMSMKAVLDGVCSVEDIDKAIMYGPGLRMAITGQLLTMSLGVPGGFREMSAKYGHTDPEIIRQECEIADGVDAEIENREEFMGRTVEDIIKFRDKTIVDILKLYRKF